MRPRAPGPRIGRSSAPNHPGSRPARTCLGCRVTRPKPELLRVVRGPDGVHPDPSGKAPGRGAYVHRDRDCVREATRRGALARALRVNLSPDDLATLRREIEREIE
ncbi:MAG TPA: YlxR family protein [Actinomycetota bacterium]|nr:YlxR family protein [Actinomycetota bacterium]